jgi:hypothetical protein
MDEEEIALLEKELIDEETREETEVEIAVRKSVFNFELQEDDRFDAFESELAKQHAAEIQEWEQKLKEKEDRELQHLCEALDQALQDRVREQKKLDEIREAHRLKCMAEKEQMEKDIMKEIEQKKQAIQDQSKNTEERKNNLREKIEAIRERKQSEIEKQVKNQVSKVKSETDQNIENVKEDRKNDTQLLRDTLECESDERTEAEKVRLARECKQMEDDIRKISKKFPGEGNVCLNCAKMSLWSD